MGKITLARIDSRLANGSVVKDWCDSYNLKKVIIANDRTATDHIRIEVMDLTVPDFIESTYLKVANVKDFLDKNEGEYFLLIKNTGDLEKIIDSGAQITEVNVGVIHLSIGKKSLTELVAVDDEDMRIFEKIKNTGIKIFIKTSINDKEEKII
ncbi:PTS sugar transporter subunit IIB [Anaerococcus murdochii]|uniref:PTS sugar transporter subunit IIB n=1 Tax=Anaerococcus murdochii TaxID=411577 RepID=A0ABS7SXM1_9FIRM|nr:PTS sugar transporter subunit IIB [Anaerococcus murdochii]MBZ2386231.1 PTS sugar transporter subunit IIB [Anaerococcus murdochii]